MRIAYFSPLPPARSGIADYSATLLDHIGPLAEVETFSQAPGSGFDPARYDAILYQLGNNPFHTFVYEAALRHPGIVVLHEANLHHLVADFTIRRDDWTGYLREVEADSGTEARIHAERFVRTLKRGPDYDLPLLRTVLRRSKGVIVHSDYVGDAVRSREFKGPIGKIPHGAWVDPVDGAAYRARLGVEDGLVLVGMFGFLKPYKRIAESLRAFKHVVAIHPNARLVLVGEVHRDLPLASMIFRLGLSDHVRQVDFVPASDFTGYIAACDIVLNLRYPTVGETSGTLQRALGLGKPAIVSDVGSFHEYPDSVCLKTPVDSSEEGHLVEYLDLLISRPDVAAELGRRAHEWVEKECGWPKVARQYVEFAESVAAGQARDAEAEVRTAVAAIGTSSTQTAGLSHIGGESSDPQSGRDELAAEPVDVATTDDEAVFPVSPEYILSWTREEDGTRAYAETHRTRLAKTLAITPPGGPEDRVLEMGAYMQITPALQSKLGYGYVRGCYFGRLGETNHHEVTSTTGERFCCDVDLFDAERDVFPYEDGSFSTVLCCELLEHLPGDPVHMIGEINRILKPGGHLVLTTPNITSLRAMAGILQGFHPMLFSDYIKPSATGEVDPRHAREYAPRELQDLFENCGFEVTLLDTGPFRAEPNAEHVWVEHLLEKYMLTREHRGDGIYCVGRKTGGVKERYPAWLYS